MKRRTAFMLGAGTLVLAALLAWALAPRPVTVEAARVGMGPFEAGIDEEGRTRLRDRYVVSAPIAGRLQRVLLREGAVVGDGPAAALRVRLMAALAAGSGTPSSG